MEEGEKKPDAGTLSGYPQKKIVYAVVGIAVVILAVVLIAKFGYNTDLLNPAGGQMSLVQRPATLVRPNVTTNGPGTRLGITVATPAFQRVITNIPRVSPCAVNQSDDCNGACVYLQTDPNNCGSCGKTCPAYAHADPVCSGGQCVFTCSAGRGDCNNQKASDGCETCLKYDHDNCGMCGNHCGVNAFCNYGNCTFVPDQPGVGGLGNNLPHDLPGIAITEPTCD